MKTFNKICLKTDLFTDKETERTWLYYAIISVTELGSSGYEDRIKYIYSQLERRDRPF